MMYGIDYYWLIGVGIFAAKDDLVFEWVTTDWSRCSQTCGGGGFQVTLHAFLVLLY